MEILSPERGLPIPYMRRLDPIAERYRYVARPGIRAMPSGTFTAIVALALQAITLIFLLYAIWWPHPSSTSDYAFSIIGTGLLALLVLGVFLLVLRRYPGFVLAVARAPFIRLSVTDRRVLWTLPWMRGPLMEIGRERIRDALLGPVDRRGFGSAALVLAPGDPSADFDGNIHFDRLPRAAEFVAAVLG